jgi:uncharacterized membrane protein YphA (DoxX/SURF4 family)
MNIVLWILQVLLALIFISHAATMLRAATQTNAQMAYVREMPAGVRRFAGIAEGLAGIGLVLPALTGTLPWLTPLAAAGLVIQMVGAMVYHLPRRENPNIVFNAVLLVLAAFVAYGRFVLAPF